MKDYYDKVKRLLILIPETRDDDMLLYAEFCKRHSEIKSYETFYDVMTSAKQRKLPSYEGVTRARRKVQELEPYLCGNRKKARQKEERQYHDFYGSH